MLLLGLANVLDLFEEVRDPFGFAAKSYKSMYGWVPSRYKRNDFTHLVWRNLKTGYIEKVIKDGTPYLRLTSLGQKRVERNFLLLAIQKKKWDRKWRVVIFDIKEVSRKTRERFRYKLKEVGFGMLQESVFISPHDIAKDFSEFIESQGLGDSAYVLEVSSILAGNLKSLVDKVWGLTEINKVYKRIIQKIEDNDLIIFSDRRNKLNDENNNKADDNDDNIVKGIWKEYLETVLRDPFLPKELLPMEWEGEKTRTLMRKLHTLTDE